MRYQAYYLSLFVALSCFAAGCGGPESPATPKETFQTYAKALKQKDLTTMKLLLSSETLKMHEQQAKAQGVTVDDIVKREALISESQTVVKFRNEKIEGEKATLEVENSFGGWDTVPFVFEEGQWKIDKKGFADQMMREIEESQRQIEDAINQGRQGDPVAPMIDPAMSPSPANPF